MNLKVRMKNPSFWVSILLSVVAPVLAYFGMGAEQITSWAALGGLLAQAVANPYVVGMVAVSVYNTLIDPTTPGVKDSPRAMGYTRPGGKESGDDE